jgi:hypothetical protein
MAKKKRVPANKHGANPSDGKPPRPQSPISSKVSAAQESLHGRAVTTLAPLPQEVERGDWTVVIFAFMMFLTPAIGVPNELMLQDTPNLSS